MTDNNDNRYTIKTFNDCKGTCKTPIGCTCREDEEKEEPASEETRKIELKTTIVDIEETASTMGGCPCSKRRMNGGGCCRGTNKLEVYNWLENYSDVITESNMVEVQFKNTRKGYYINSNNLELFKGDIVAVEATPGHDIGEVTLTGKLVELQMKKMHFRGDVKRVYRKAKPADIEKYQQAKDKEHKTMLRAREIAEELNLDMKISDVEYQGDGNKAIFYYIADGRVDFRQLIKHYASEFRIKIEMKQIGARQEAGRVGGIGPCGRELCCSSSMSNFVSVSTQAARLQDIPLNPQKLAGQCGKLKCCLNFEVDTYVEAQKGLPSRDAILETKDGSYYHLKTDILSGTISYSTDKHFAVNVVALPRERVFEIIKQNRKGEKPLTLLEVDANDIDKNRTLDVLEQESITRFDSNNNIKREGGGDNERSQRKQRRKKRNKDQDNQEKKDRSLPANNKEEQKNNSEPKKLITNQQRQQEAANSNAEEKTTEKKERSNNRRRRNNNRPSNINKEKDGTQNSQQQGEGPKTENRRRKKNFNRGNNKNNETGASEH